ncbi:hypothetical protein [Tetragenococcus halophilus]|uniref:hypothetical protein n=1 Tax=Tetragenococcus halophilus TaxID=51669 RepID=UPI00209B01D2|nr:hypothetical protein [Tetragenococcus halophilus]MCO8287259.1 hypothetical protein [Tetragenococcus halophilus]
MDIMFDTNAFDKVIANFDIVINSSRENQYYITYVQKKELDKIPSIKQEKKDRLFEVIEELNVKKTLSSSFILNHTPLGEGKLGSGKVYNELLNASKNNKEDAIIGDTSVNEGYTLVTNDDQLYNKMSSHDYKVLKFEDFLEQL